MRRVVFLMCQGEQKRLADLGYPKQCVKVLGLPLVQRTTMQIRHWDRAPREYNTAIEVIGRRGGALEAAAEWGWSSIRELAEPGICVVDGIRGALDEVAIADLADRCLAPALIDRFYILLGDVAWTEDAIIALLEDTRPIVFAGTSDVSASLGEVFGMAFDAEFLPTIRGLADTCPCRIRPDGTPLSLGKQQRGGHLRRLLWWTMAQSELVAERSNVTWSAELYLPIDDATDDIDTPKDIRNLPALERALSESFVARRDRERLHGEASGETAHGPSVPPADRPATAVEPELA